MYGVTVEMLESGIPFIADSVVAFCISFCLRAR